MRIVDLTQLFTAHPPVFPGDPPARLEPIATIGRDGYASHRIATGVHVGTHMDAPAHMISGGQLLSQIPVERFFGRGVLVDARHAKTVSTAMLRDVALRRGDAVLVLTGWSRRFRQPNYFTDYPELSESFAQRLADAGVHLVGMDTPSPDRPPYLVHRLLLGHEVLIIENLVGLEQLLGGEPFAVTALPAKWEADAAPVRVVARLP